MIGRIIRFICLKAMEATAFLGIPLGIGKIAFLYPNYIKFLEVKGIDFWSVWVAGFASLFLFLCVMIIVVGLILIPSCIIKQNWEWAK